MKTFDELYRELLKKNINGDESFSEECNPYHLDCLPVIRPFDRIKDTTILTGSVISTLLTLFHLQNRRVSPWMKQTVQMIWVVFFRMVLCMAVLVRRIGIHR